MAEHSKDPPWAWRAVWGTRKGAETKETAQLHWGSAEWNIQKYQRSGQGEKEIEDTKEKGPK